MMSAIIALCARTARESWSDEYDDDRGDSLRARVIEAREEYDAMHAEIARLRAEVERLTANMAASVEEVRRLTAELEAAKAWQARRHRARPARGWGGW